MFGILLACTKFKIRTRLDHRFRYLPKVPEGGGVLLDVGCGDGSFLIDARNCGWNVVGVDPDPNVAANATILGLKVHVGGVELFGDEKELFDVITLSHVVEHLHDPVNILKTCYALFKTGGQLWW